MSQSPEERPGSAPTERAEVLVDQLGARLGQWFTAANHQVRKMTALAREEAEDIWAEAQSIRRSDRTHSQ